MKKLFVKLIFTLMLPILACSWASAETFTDYKSFKARYQEAAQTPYGALEMHFAAIFSYINPDNRAEAGKMLRYSMHYNMPIERSRNHATFLERMKDPSYNFVFRSYYKGSSPENNYHVDFDSAQLNVVSKRNSEDYLKLALQSSGADSPRLVWLRQHDGLWYVENNSSIYSQIRKPKQMLDQKKNSHDADYDFDESSIR